MSDRTQYSRGSSDPIAEAHDVLARHYGEPVLPVGKVCDRLGQYVKALAEGKATARPDYPASPYSAEVTDALIRYGPTILTFARKSNLLWRLLYLGQPLRTRKCPVHAGHWSGCHPEPCPYGCSVGSDVTGWLP